MKIKIQFIALLMGAFLAGSSCNMLDVDETTGMSQESIFEISKRSRDFLTGIYTYLPSGFQSVDGTMRSCATDDAEYVWSNSEIRYMNDGSWSSTNTVDAQWANYYSGIRACNQFLENFSMEVIEKYQYATDYKDMVAHFKNYEHEVRFLRAFFHFELAKRYGDIPLIEKVLSEKEANAQSKTKFADVVTFISSECNIAAQNLPVNYAQMPGARETGRVTKGAAMALKSRALLYAASKLHNPENDVEKWKLAASATLALIDSAQIKGWHSLIDNSFNPNVHTSKELILERREAASNYFEKDNFPYGFEGGKTGVCPTQNLVDAFEMTAASGGGKFDWNDLAHALAPFKNRDQRLNKTIVTHDSKFKNVVVDCSIGGANGYPLEGASKTGYYLRKYIIETVNLAPSNTTTAVHYWSIFRYGEIVLNYAEAMNEAFPASSTYTDSKFTRSAEWALNLVKSRAKIKTVNNLNYLEFREAVRNERRVELAFEDHRFWDLRRWMIADQTTSIYATKIEKEPNGTFTYTPSIKIAERVWNNKMYLYPIPDKERFINPALGQNTGW